MGWESFLQQYEKTPGWFFVDDDAKGDQPNRRKSAHQPRPNKPTLTVDTSRLGSQPKRQTKRERCVEQLKLLGFGSKEEGGEERLIIYAEAAEGDLASAIEILEEERKAYKERGGI
jgi:hypothetical protein